MVAQAEQVEVPRTVLRGLLDRLQVAEVKIKHDEILSSRMNSARMSPRSTSTHRFVIDPSRSKASVKLEKYGFFNVEAFFDEGASGEFELTLNNPPKGACPNDDAALLQTVNTHLAGSKPSGLSLSTSSLTTNPGNKGSSSDVFIRDKVFMTDKIPNLQFHGFVTEKIEEKKKMHLRRTAEASGACSFLFNPAAQSNEGNYNKKNATAQYKLIGFVKARADADSVPVEFYMQELKIKDRSNGDAGSTGGALAGSPRADGSTTPGWNKEATMCMHARLKHKSDLLLGEKVSSYTFNDTVWLELNLVGKLSAPVHRGNSENSTNANSPVRVVNSSSSENEMRFFKKGDLNPASPDRTEYAAAVSASPMDIVPEQDAGKPFYEGEKKEKRASTLSTIQLHQSSSISELPKTSSNELLVETERTNWTTRTAHSMLEAVPVADGPGNSDGASSFFGTYKLTNVINMQEYLIAVGIPSNVARAAAAGGFGINLTKLKVMEPKGKNEHRDEIFKDHPELRASIQMVKFDTETASGKKIVQDVAVFRSREEALKLPKQRIDTVEKADVEVLAYFTTENGCSNTLCFEFETKGQKSRMLRQMSTDGKKMIWSLFCGGVKAQRIFSRTFLRGVGIEDNGMAMHYHSAETHDLPDTYEFDGLKRSTDLKLSRASAPASVASPTAGPKKKSNSGGGSGLFL